LNEGRICHHFAGLHVNVNLTYLSHLANGREGEKHRHAPVNPVSNEQMRFARMQEVADVRDHESVGDHPV